MIPDLQASFVCEDVRVEASGAHTIIGIMNFLPAPMLPVHMMKMCLWTRWCSGVGEFTQTARIICPDEETQLAEASATFQLKEEEGHVTNVNVFAGLEFTQEGNHHIEIMLDSTLKLRFPLNVVVVKPPPNWAPGQ